MINRILTLVVITHARSSIFRVFLFLTSTYYNDPKFSDRQAWANSVDSDQTAVPEQSDQGCTVSHSICNFWTHYSMIEPHCLNFRIITSIF